MEHYEKGSIIISKDDKEWSASTEDIVDCAWGSGLGGTWSTEAGKMRNSEKAIPPYCGGDRRGVSGHWRTSRSFCYADQCTATMMTYLPSDNDGRSCLALFLMDSFPIDKGLIDDSIYIWQKKKLTSSNDFSSESFYEVRKNNVQEKTETEAKEQQKNTERKNTSMIKTEKYEIFIIAMEIHRSAEELKTQNSRRFEIKMHF